VNSIREEWLYYISSIICLSPSTYELVLFLSTFIRMHMSGFLFPLDLNWFQTITISVFNSRVMIPEWIAAAHTYESDVYTSVPHNLLVFDRHPIGQFTMNWAALSESALFIQTAVRWKKNNRYDFGFVKKVVTYDGSCVTIYILKRHNSVV